LKKPLNYGNFLDIDEFDLFLELNILRKIMCEK